MSKLSPALTSSALLMAATLLTACAATTGPDIADAQEKGLPVLITNIDTYRNNPELVKISEKVAEEENIQSGLEKPDKADAANTAPDAETTEPEHDVVGFYVRFINLLDQDIQEVTYTLRAFDSDYEEIVLADSDGQLASEPSNVEAKATEAEIKDKAPETAQTEKETIDLTKSETGEQAFSTVDTENNTLMISRSEVIKPGAFNHLNYGHFQGVSPNIQIDCVVLLKLSITTADGETLDYDGDEVLSSSQTPRCQPSPAA